MPEAIQSWLGTRLGVLLDVSPDKFGRNTKDGKLLAKLLYSYGVIPAHVLDNVKESKNFYECYNNLVVLKPWLRYIGVIHDDCTLQQMAGGEGSAAISVFYAVYLNLERKDRLHYLSAQKERRMSEEGCQRFKVNWVPERFVSPQSENAPAHISALFLEKSEMIEWHKEKCKQVVEQIKKTKARFRKLNDKKQKLGPILSKHATSQPLEKKQTEAEKMRLDIDAFEAKHAHENPDLNFSELVELQNLYEMQPCFQPNVAEAKNIVTGIKRRKKGETYARSFQQKMQSMLLDEQWKEVVEKQEKDFESAVCAKLLKQSQYEKQMMKRLYLLRNQKKVFAENRRKIENLKVEVRQREVEEYGQTTGERGEDDWAGEGFEKERMAELHRRMYNHKVQSRRVGIRAECQRICEALIDIAIRISEAREVVGCQVPKSFMKDLMELFFKDLPIFDIFDHFEELYDRDSQPDLYQANEWGEEEPDGFIFYQSSDYERLRKEELDRQTVLDECDLNDYLQLMGPWLVELLFPYGSETEEKNQILGYIVHKVLAVKYPPPNVPGPVAIRPMKYKSIVQGLKDDTARNMLTDLLEMRNIIVIRVEDAINFVLAAYKEELSSVNDVYLAFQRSTDDALKHRSFSGKEKEAKKKIQLLKARNSDRPLQEDETEERVADKETQTPKVIPDGDVPLSANANLGKQAFEALGVGDPVPDAVIIPAVVGYVVAKQDDIDGWVLLNYPRCYNQASELEAILTGCRNLPILYQMEAAEESEEYNYRGQWSDLNSKDVFCDCRTSRLLPNPYVLSTTGLKMPRTYFNSFIKLKKVSDSPRLPQVFEDFNLMERFYFDSEIFLDFEYQNLNFQAIKNLGKAILGTVKESQDLMQKTSLEVFGSAVLDVNEKWEPKKKTTKEAEGLKKPYHENKASVVTESSVFEAFMSEGRKNTVDEEEKEREVEEEQSVEVSRPKPGDPNWEWASGPQSKSFMVAQASLWERLEAVYVEDFKNVFFCLRVHRYNLINYCGFLKKSLRAVMRKCDERQKVLADFQQMFNEIDEDLRPDEDVKCELHVRVSELEQALMGLADERKSDSLKDSTKMARDPWVPDEIASLVNTFLTALQLEADRCVGSCQVIMDYYLMLQQKVPDEKPIAKVVVPMLQIQDRKYSISSTFSNKNGSTGSPRVNESKRLIKSLSDQNKFAQEKPNKRSFGEKKRRNSENNLLGAADFIADILTNLSLPEDGLTPFHTFFMDNVKAVTNDLKSTVEGCISEVRKNEKPRPNTRQTKGFKKISEINISSATANENFVAEWLSALENELARFIFRSQLILARGIFEINEFLTTVLNMLFALSEEIMEMYLKEIQSISECCKVFRCGIEEEVQIRPRLELKNEQFIVHLDDQETSPTEGQDHLVVEEEHETFRFTVDQLSLLFHKLQRVAPGGEIIKQSLIYIFEDLRVLKPEVQNSGCFPEIWGDLEPDDIVTILNEVYQNLEVVHWKDFIIYALDLPLPSQDEILTMRHSFRKYDPQVTELISRENYETISFWFENSRNKRLAERRKSFAKAKDLLYRMYQVNAFQTNYSALLLAFCKDENPVVGFQKALALSLGKEVLYKEDTDSVAGENWSYEYGARGGSDRDPSDGIGNCSITSSEPTPKCIPKEKIVKCECKDDEEESLAEESSAKQEWDYNESEMEGEESFYYPPEALRRHSAASFVPYTILSSLLKASFPSLPQFSILLDCAQTFQETLSAIYDSLESYDNNVEVHSLINHKFINRLLFTTNKFKFVKLKPLLLSLAKVKSPMPKVVCIEGKPKFSSCVKN